MYVPKQFDDLNHDEIIAFIREYSFGILVSVDHHVPVATHLPFSVCVDDDSHIILTSHLAKPNIQANEIQQKRVLVIFSAPHAYISPKHYESRMSVPTWNYVAIHAYGHVEVISEEGEVLAALEEMIDAYEPDYRAQWDTLPADYKSKMSKGIVAFRVAVDEVLAVNKLSQNKKDVERERIIGQLKDSPYRHEVSIAERMGKNGKKK